MIPIAVKQAKTLQEKAIGLIGKKHITHIYFETRWGIHTFGVQQPIDIVILDKNNIVRKTRQHLLPNRIFLWNPKYNRVLELSQGTIEKQKIKIGTSVQLSFLMT